MAWLYEGDTPALDRSICVILAKAGLGKVNTAALAGIIWERHHPEAMLLTGVAGGLDPSLGIGDIAIGERTIQHDWGASFSQSWAHRR